MNDELCANHSPDQDPDQAWFWGREWQEGECCASEQIDAGGLQVYDDMESLFADGDK